MIAIWQMTAGKTKVFFSTDTEMPREDVIVYYRTRFQLEFCFSDSMGLLVFATVKQEARTNLTSLSMHLSPQSMPRRFSGTSLIGVFQCPHSSC
ncbi:MAG: hypothetical protein KBT40_00410 [bacterium]|nr:hypothetical protein [Candidatus Minthenecus merdequi]